MLQALSVSWRKLQLWLSINQTGNARNIQLPKRHTARVLAATIEEISADVILQGAGNKKLE